jgi:hypothetical protein
MAQYDVVPFVAQIDYNEGTGAAAAQLSALINARAQDGWSYVRLESVEIHQAGNSGCLGIGATPGQITHFKMAVFER